MAYTLEFQLLPDEAWYGANINDGHRMPLTKRSRVKMDTRYITSYNQASPLWVSTKGRYLWSEDGYLTTWRRGKVSCTSEKSEIRMYEGFGDLKGACAAASKAHFPFDGTLPDEMMFRGPQYCTWIHLATNQNEKDILAFAEGILKAGMSPGELIIDDGWQTTFGQWEFHPNKFKDPKGMIEKLHQMGFKVIMWICPFVSVKAAAYNHLAENKMLVRDKSGKIASREWWNGSDPVLDLSNPAAMKWFQDLADSLMNDFGVDGFKQDAGDSYFYMDDDQTFDPGVDANTQCLLWAASARKYRFNELRACFKGGGWGITQRLSDKFHSWKSNGLNTLVPNVLLQGYCGYPYSCPDMIGGGVISSFKEKVGDEFLKDKPDTKFDKELLIRWAQCSALMPMMQYSFALWNLEDQNARKACIAAAKLHEQYADTIIALAENASQTGEPIIRSLEYSYPGQGYAAITDTFMLGDDLLVAPVLKKRKRKRKVTLPAGKQWKYLHDGKLYEGGQTVTVPAPLEVLPLFEAVK